MADWAYALSQAAAAGANTGADIVGTQMKIGQQTDAEQVAANIKLDTAQRMLAIEDAMKNRAAERFAATVKDKMGEQVPVAPEPVSQTGVTRASSGDYEVAPGQTVGADFAQTPAQIAQTVASMTAVANNPASTPEEKADAQGAIQAITAQAGGQAKVNAAAADGKTRPRTWAEAQQAALEDTSQNDAPAFIAGTGMLATGAKQDLAAKTLQTKEDAIMAKLEGVNNRTDMMGAIAELKSRINGGDSEKLPANAKMIEYLVANGKDRKGATDMVMGTGAGATKDPVSMAATLASGLIGSGMVRVDKNDPPGTTVASKAMNMAMDQIGAAETRFRNQPAGGAPVQATPAAPGAAPNPAGKDPLGLFK